MSTPIQHSPHPVINPLVQHDAVHSPVRDDEALGPTEDLDREPDGMPHQVIGLTALFSVMLAMLFASNVRWRSSICGPKLDSNIGPVMARK